VKNQPALTSVVIRAAVYSGGQTPATPAARVQAAQGVVGVSFRTTELVRSVLSDELLRDAVLRIVDPRARSQGENALLFDSDWLDVAAAPAGSADAAGAPLHASIRVADRSWDLVVLPRAQGLAVDGTTGWLLALGLALSASLTVMTQVLVQANVSALRKIREGTAELDLEKTNLERLESQYRTLFMHSRDAVLRTVPDGQVLAANPAACALFGGTESELLAARRQLLVDETDPRSAQLSAIRRATGSAQGQMRLLRVDGTPFEAEIATSTYTEPGPEGRMVASVIVRDISERQAMELRLRESQKMESIGTLAGGVAHDFNNVLAVILGNVSLARRAIAADDPAQASLALIHQAASRARGLVQQIMTFSRRGPQLRTVQALQPLVVEAVALLRSTLPTGVQLDVQLDGEPLRARVDASQVHQVVMNLCTNAWQALPEAAGRIQVRLDRWEPDGQQGQPAQRSNWARLQVIDNGIGMDDATRLRVFEPFFTTKPVGQGTGLGLAVVHGIVTASGGRIAVDSQPGAGSRFEVLLPLAENEAAVISSEPAPPPEGGGQGEHVLYVDDDEVVAITVQALLEAAGYRVSRLIAAPQAIERVQADPAAYDLVITDFNMPGPSGIALAEALKHLAPDLPVVITSGHVTDELRERARQAGVRAVLLKENSFEELGSIVRTILGPAQQHAPVDLSPRN
jgi:PAS domain S-box-containing protein